MDPVKDRLSKLREDRVAREKARIEKLREFNLKKYSKIESSSVWSQPKKPIPPLNSSVPLNLLPKKNSILKNNFHVNSTYKRPASGPAHLMKSSNKESISKSNVKVNKINKDESNNNESSGNQNDAQQDLTESQEGTTVTQTTCNTEQDRSNFEINKKNSSEVVKTNCKQFASTSVQSKPSTSVQNKLSTSMYSKPSTSVHSKISTYSLHSKPSTSNNVSRPTNSKKSIQFEKVTQDAGEGTSKRVSVFERLYKPKTVPKAKVDDAQKLKTDPRYLKKVLGNAEKITGKRHTISCAKPEAPPVRRSISAVHLRKTNKSELGKCIHTWASVGEKLNKVNMNEVDEDDDVEYDKVVSAVKSERKKVKFLTPISIKYNTPRPEELQERLKKWLDKRGKSLNSYQHLQCFGIYHMSKDPVIALPTKPELYDEENKENIALESDSDDRSYTENLNDRNDDFVKENKEEVNYKEWRRASTVSDNTSLNESKNLTLTPSDDYNHVDELLLGALNDLTELLREGFDWGQCARWLRAIHQRFPSASQSAAYWQCRAALEERRGDLPASMQCWEEAFAAGSEHSVVEENLDQLLDKFMQLKISPSSGRQKQVDPKMVNVKNVMKSTIIRFAVQKAKLRQSNQQEAAAYTVTPVRRSARLSMHSSAKRTPLQVCSTLSQASNLGHPLVFVPNDRLFGTP